MDKNEKVGYYAIIPAHIRYDNELPANAKLLYGEITALCNKEGYCWATNDYFAKLYDCSKSTISRLISNLKKRGYIKTISGRKDGSGEEQRYIQICEDAFSKMGTVLPENAYDTTQNCEATMLKNEKDNNTRDIITFKTKTNKKKYKTDVFDYASILATIEDDELRDLYTKFLEMREYINAPMTDYALGLLIKRVNTLEPQRIDRQKEMLEAAIVNRWKSVYPLRGDEGNRSTESNSGEVQFGLVL